MNQEYIEFKVDALVRGLQFSINNVLDRRHADIKKMIENRLNNLKGSGELQGIINKTIDNAIIQYTKQALKSAFTDLTYGEKHKELSIFIGDMVNGTILS